MSTLRLGLNIDHVATLRNARGGAFPDPVSAAQVAVKAGADGITAHLREDRRHIGDEDVRRLRQEVDAPLNLEMAATEEMVRIAEELRPHACCLVPENRMERTTEGGLDIASQHTALIPFILRLKTTRARVSLFIEPEQAQIEGAAKSGVDIVELHTGAWCEAVRARSPEADVLLARLRTGARMAAALGMEVHAGHGLDYNTARLLAATSEFMEFNIGHFLIGEAVIQGLDASVRRMKAEMNAGRAHS